MYFGERFRGFTPLSGHLLTKKYQFTAWTKYNDFAKEFSSNTEGYRLIFNSLIEFLAS